MDFELINSPAFGDTLYDTIIKEWLNNRTLIINQEINDDVLEMYVMQILKWNQEDINIPVEKRVPIKLIINSVGGSLIDGMALIDMINLSKTKVIGVGVGLVASAAFYIFLACKERVAFLNTTFLMHDGEVSFSQTSSKSRDTMAYFDTIDQRVKDLVLSRSTFTEEFYDEHYHKELYMFPDEMKKYGCVDKIVGEDVDIDYILS